MYLKNVGPKSLCLRSYGMKAKDAIEYLKSQGVDLDQQDDFLDKAVETVKLDEAGKISNQGFDSQLEYLLSGLSEEKAKARLDTILQIGDIDKYRCRYSDCSEQHPITSEFPSCPSCLDYLGRA